MNTYDILKGDTTIIGGLSGITKVHTQHTGTMGGYRIQYGTTSYYPRLRIYV